MFLLFYLVSALFDVNIFCMYRHTDKFKKFVNNKRIKLGVDNNGIPIYKLHEPKKRSREASSSKQDHDIDN